MNASASTPASTLPATPPAPGHPHRRGLRNLLLTVMFLLALLLIVGGGILAVLTTDWGARTAWRAATAALGDRLSGTLVGGNPADGLVLHDVHYRDAGRIVKLDRFAGALHLSWSPVMLTIDSLRLGQVDVTLLPTPPEPLQAPARLTLPFAFALKQLEVKQLNLHKSGATTQIDALRATASSDRMHHRVQLQHAGTQYGEVQGALGLTGKAPFAIDGTLGLVSTFDGQRYVVDGTLRGSLGDLGMTLRGKGGKLDGTADISAAPFDAVPLRQVRLALQHLDPRVFAPAAPQADLNIKATLVLVAGDASRSGQLVVSGPVVVANAAPGRIDQGRLPLLAARADVVLDASRRQVRGLDVTLPGNGRLSGQGAMAAKGEGAFHLRATGLDLHALHAALAPTRLDGPIDIGLQPGAQNLVLELQSTALSIAANAHADAGKVVVQSARLQAGASQVGLSGSVTRDGRTGFVVKASFRDFDPAVVLAQVQVPPVRPTGAAPRKPAAAAPQARINMDVDATGALQPQLDARLDFAIRDSSYDRLPLTGGGTLQVRGKRLLASDARLSIAGNEAFIKGAFGAPSDRLDVHLDAPALVRLGFGLSGQARADGQVRGSVDQPVIEASWQARDLVVGTNRLSALAGQVRLDGLPARNPQARVALTLDARGVQGGPAALEQLTARIDGSFARHTIDLKTNGRLSGQPLALSIAAQGNLSQAPDPAWSGVVSTLDNRGLPRLAIGAPLTLSVARDRIELGATRLTLGPADIDLKQFQYRPGVLRAQGAFAALRVADVLALQRKLTGTAPPVSTSLVLDGSWDIDLGPGTARGFARIARRGGDVVVSTPFGANAIGLGILQLRADLQGERMHLDSRIEASRVGTLAASGDVGLLRDGGSTALPLPGPASALSGSLELVLPALRNVAGLSGPAIALDGSINLAMQAAGSLGRPVVSGILNGDRLALTMFDQGVRLRDGTARIALNNNFVELREVVFHGGGGTLRATGRIPLDQSDTGLAALITADRLQLLNDPARQLTLSGQARVANIARQLNVSGRFTVDRGRFSLPEKSAPKLSDDVVIVHRDAMAPPDSKGGKDRVAMPGRVPGSATSANSAATASATSAKSPPAAPGLLPPRVNVVVDLGNDLRFKGGGADLFLAGAIDIRSAPNHAPQAFGTVRVASGAYEAFGARLDIERGLITFQGPFDNPSINLLAMRRNQTVPAGVQVTGNVQQPHVELVSEPNLGEDQKLSWLVFGHGDSGSSTSGSSGGTGASGGAAAQAKGAVQSAALGLVNKFGGSRLAENVGLDKLSIGASEYGTGSGQVVNLGKEISKRLFIGYEQGLAGAESALKLTYELTQHWSLILRGGAVAGLDVNYSRRFDHMQAQ